LKSELSKKKKCDMGPLKKAKWFKSNYREGGGGQRPKAKSLKTGVTEFGVTGPSLKRETRRPAPSKG